MSAPNYLNKVYRYVALSVVLLALIGVCFAFLPKIQQFQSYEETQTRLKNEISAEKERIKELRHNQEKFSTDKNFVQKKAHEIGFAHEGETIYQFDEPLTNSKAREAQ